MHYYILCSLKRRKTANLVTVGISVMLVVLLNLYFGNIYSYQKQLEELAQNVPVYCQVVNLSGSLGNGLFISEKTVDGLLSSDKVTDESCMTVLMAGEGDFEPADYARNLNLFAAGVNRLEAAGELDYDVIHMDRESVDQLLASDRQECIVSEKVLRKHQWKVGDTILLNFYYYGADSEFTKLELHPMGGVAEVKIAGSMEDLLGKNVNAVGMHLILPFEALRNIYHQFQVPFFADTFTFHVKDPLELNAFKEEMKSIGLMETMPDVADSYTGCALAVRDKSFIESATDLWHSIELMQSFFPVVCILVLLIGYVVSFLSGNSRKEEYALLRLQGAGKWKGSLLFLTEQILMVLAGNILGDIIVLLVFQNVHTIIVVNGVLLGSYLIGASAAYGWMSRGSVVYLLSAQQ